MEIIGNFRGARDDSRKFVGFMVTEVFRGGVSSRGTGKLESFGKIDRSYSLEKF